MQSLKESSMSKARKLELIKLVTCHFIPLNLLIWVQEKAKLIVNESAPRQTFTTGKLPASEWEKRSLTWAHTLIELATKGITKIPGEMTSKLRRSAVADSNALLRQINSRIKRYARLLAGIEEHLVETESLRDELRQNSTIPPSEQSADYFEHPFLDHLLLIWLADMSSKQDDITTRPDINDYLLISSSISAEAHLVLSEKE